MKSRLNKIVTKLATRKRLIKAAKSTRALSNSLKETLKAGKAVLKALKRIQRYFPMQKVKKPVFMQISKDVVTK